MPITTVTRENVRISNKFRLNTNILKFQKNENNSCEN
jgi:hypothetical protein